MESIQKLIDNPPTALVIVVLLFLAVLAILWFALPFIVMSINSKLKMAVKNTALIHDELISVQHAVEKLRKEGNIASLMARDEGQQ